MADVAVLGMGNMGAAVARALLADGRSVLVWNRTATRCEPLANEGAEVAPTPTSAILGAPVVIASVLDYRALKNAMADQLDLTERTVINLTWGTTDEARELAELVSTRGGRYVEGGVLCRPEAIGHPEGDILYSGPTGSIEEVRSLLASLGPIHYVGSDLAQANALALALGSIFYASVLSFLEAVAYADRLGISADVMAPLVRIPLGLAGSTIDASVDQIERQDFIGSEASNAVHSAALASVAQAFTAADIEHRLTDAVSSYFDSAAQLGLSHLEVGALLRIMSRTAAEFNAT
ncbi:NAD(P)-dependent oxidoreductase [Paenarthrobacter sp. RAF54_2]|uniref:NAD(P)-dependent oxidoreductase n=1 Tax=Paenarthrobacter sp. RAF54_2 TaxID=3233061 RepID=UPI003F969C3E